MSALVLVAILAADGGTTRAAQLYAEGRAAFVRHDDAGILEARKKFQQCVDLEPENTECIKLLAASWGLKGKKVKADEAKALALYKRFLEIAPHPDLKRAPNASPMGDWGGWESPPDDWWP